VPSPASPSLEPLGPGVHAWIEAPPAHGTTNAGVIIEEDGITVVDCLLTPDAAQQLVDELAGFELPVRRAIYTSSHIEFVGGSTKFWMAARYGRRQTSVLLDQPPNVAVFRRLYPEAADVFDDEFTTRPVSHTVDEPAWLSPAVCAVPTQGQQLENLVGLVPGADVLFAGAMASFGVTPNCFDGDPTAWADALGQLQDLATTIVPGIGPVGGAAEVLELQAYLYACSDAEGDRDAIPSGPWDAWSDRHLDEVNVERAALLAAGDDSVPPSMLRLAGLS
jgi:glyoxylase-like metal-dependent hydrolase (beta-lactamase superfamily II)